MECPNCRRVEEGNWLMLGGSQSTDDAIYDVPYDFDDDEYLGLPVDALDNEMREVSLQRKFWAVVTLPRFALVGRILYTRIKGKG